jgi:type 1 fimbria pilin
MTSVTMSVKEGTNDTITLKGREIKNFPTNNTPTDIENVDIQFSGATVSDNNNNIIVNIPTSTQVNSD